MNTPDTNISIWFPPLVLAWACLFYLLLVALTCRFPGKCKLINRVGFFHFFGGYFAGTIIDVLTNHLEVSKVAHFVFALLAMGMVWFYPLAIALFSILLVSPKTWRRYCQIQRTSGRTIPTLSRSESQPALSLHAKAAKS